MAYRLCWEPLLRDALHIECKADSRFTRPKEFDKLQEEWDAVWDFLGGMDTFGEQRTVSVAPKALKEVEKPLEASKGASRDPASFRGEGQKSETPFMVHVLIFSLV